MGRKTKHETILDQGRILLRNKFWVSCVYFRNVEVWIIVVTKKQTNKETKERKEKKGKIECHGLILWFVTCTKTALKQDNLALAITAMKASFMDLRNNFLHKNRVWIEPLFVTTILKILV